MQKGLYSAKGIIVVIVLRQVPDRLAEGQRRDGENHQEEAEAQGQRYGAHRHQADPTGLLLQLLQPCQR